MHLEKTIIERGKKMSVCQCFFGTHLFFDMNEDAIDCWLNSHKKENSCCYPKIVLNSNAEYIAKAL